tara:strand:+ start:49 stop:468 length:420 start_codon:yes stop_codon:yes gene_type:complete
MSTILVNTLTGTSTAGSIVVTGEGNSTTTNLQQGLAKAWASVQKYSSNISIFDSLNVSSGVDDGVGLTTLNWSNNMSAAGHYAAGGMSSDQNYMCANQGRTAAAGTALTTSSGAFSTVSDAGADKDSNVNLIAIHGDLA